MGRDFTYIDDLVEAVVRLGSCVPRTGDPVAQDGVVDSLSPVGPSRVVNIAGGMPVGLMDFIGEIEKTLARSARKNMLPMQPGDVRETFADHHLLEALTGYRPSTPVEVGVREFVEWYVDRYGR